MPLLVTNLVCLSALNDNSITPPDWLDLNLLLLPWWLALTLRQLLNAVWIIYGFCLYVLLLWEETRETVKIALICRCNYSCKKRRNKRPKKKSSDMLHLLLSHHLIYFPSQSSCHYLISQRKRQKQGHLAKSRPSQFILIWVWTGWKSSSLSKLKGPWTAISNFTIIFSLTSGLFRLVKCDFYEGEAIKCL